MVEFQKCLLVCKKKPVLTLTELFCIVNSQLTESFCLWGLLTCLITWAYQQYHIKPTWEDKLEPKEWFLLQLSVIRRGDFEGP